MHTFGFGLRGVHGGGGRDGIEDGGGDEDLDLIRKHAASG